MLPEIPEAPLSVKPGNLRKGATSVKWFTNYGN